ncbi:class I SAM-dependent methyltransferase [Roseibaca sp. V10]|uniref:Class I SAM-dependent methyltransferase n=1 Tax=Roseinatronobacter domitianus TaxID=2940293 RepID=A0ABT0M3I5_9RHOB|nr:class I SAM-dependent methyltransferase [Roseibaca domitiana]MCL1629168.1 class I SAM-dependent methyltransferase [Roseibaca domitiana]
MLTNSEIHSRLGHVPYMTIEQADRITALIAEHKLSSVLELGFYHGISTCYMANAVSDFPNGHVTAIDREKIRDMQPSAGDLLAKIGLRDKVSLNYEHSSYLWRLMKMLEEDPTPRFDLCYLDGAHNWDVDGFAFFLVDRLLKPGGWIILDDLDWTYGTSESMRNSERVLAMPDEERNLPQMRKVYELLIKRQPGYGNFRTEDNWAYAQKISDGSDAAAPVIQKEIVIQEKRIGLGAALIRFGKRLGM